jgi:methionyl-tRNA formyltransferase
MVVVPVPIVEAAKLLELKVHQIETFTGWEVKQVFLNYFKIETDPLKPPPGINLIIAVSFGLLVPPRILGKAKYGGLNVHPSMLPEYVDSIRLLNVSHANTSSVCAVRHQFIMPFSSNDPTLE